ncbi:hypothetical protein AJ80_05850 [Polytolypa hystricis UAMH7299]|uniref:Uncharacterized protein n=1 Tax=Polytolypa hystricis (strain UAMH7299) TaxID=1447883 RepID=A0A2B7Y0H9_POLH7|nr:hypothetical protein AJ80_05850 [Polytolypa hystricis UAMH7299]
MVFGSVLVSSGRTLDDERISNWAFVEISASKREQIHVPNILPTLPPNVLPHDDDDGNNVYLSAGDAASSFGAIMPDEWYFKCGRTTDITAGTCNGVELHVNWSDTDRCRYDLDRNEPKVRLRHTKELVIVGHKLHSAGYQTPFCEAGDSSSMIINQSGQICGLI